MTSISPISQPRSHQPFLPSNFYEAPRADRPTEVALTLPETSASTVKKPSLRAKTAPTKQTGRGAPKKVTANLLKPYLQGFNHPTHALTALPEFDHIVTGAVCSDLGGNTRPLSKRLVVTLLQRLDEISTGTVKEYFIPTLRSCSDRKAQKYSLILRVIVNAAMPIAEAKWPSPADTSDEHDFGSVNYIHPCGNPSCIVCAGSTSQESDWLEFGTNKYEVPDYTFAVMQ